MSARKNLSSEILIYNREAESVIDSGKSTRLKDEMMPGFGERLGRLRKARGLTQTELGKKVGLSQRMVAYYEKDEAQPPGPMLIDLANILGTSVDELLGKTEAAAPLPDPKEARFLKRLKRIQELPPQARRAILKVLDALLAQHETRQPA